MASYLSKIKEGTKLVDLLDNTDFKQDLYNFFRTGGRYSYTNEEMDEIGWEGLVDKFAEHMRYQSTNEYTAASDLFFAKNDKTPEYAKESFGNLMQAWDSSDGAGTNYAFAKGVGDYLGGFVTAPSTLVTVGTMGFGVGSKLAARGTNMVAQAQLRKVLGKYMVDGLKSDAAEEFVKKAATDQVRKDIASGTFSQGVKEVAKTPKFLGDAVGRQAARVLPGSSAKEALRSAGTTFAVEGTLGGAMAYASEEARAETIDDYEYGWEDIAIQGGIAGAVGAGLGGGLGYYASQKRNQAYDMFLDQAKTFKENADAARVQANATLRNKKNNKASVAATDRTAALLERLDPDMVAKGDELRKLLSDDSVDGIDKMLSSRGFSLDTIRGVSAALVDLQNSGLLENFDLSNSGLRISQRVANFLNDETKTPAQQKLLKDFFDDVMSKYNLTPEEISYMYLSDFSEAGRTLQTASELKKQLGKFFQKGTIDRNLETLSENGLLPSGSEQVAREVKRAAQEEGGLTSKIGKGTHWALNQWDKSSIAMMTTQLGTSVANIGGSALNVGASISDDFFRGLIRTSKGDLEGGKRALSGITSTVRGMAFRPAELDILKYLMAQEKPDDFSRTFSDVSRADEAIGNDSSMVLRLARRFNHINAVTDAYFKEGIFYSELDKQLKLKGTNVRDFLKEGKTLRDLGNTAEGVPIFDKAVDEARRITMQRTYYGDKSYFGKSSAAISRFHQNTPFVMSQGFGLPFPRYLTNHLEMMSDYTPIGLAGAFKKQDEALYGTSGIFVDQFKLREDRIARQMTGASAMLLGYKLYESGVSPDYETLKMPGQGEEAGGYDLKRTMGPWALHMFIGEAMGRYLDGEKVNYKFNKQLFNEILDITIGTTDLGFNPEAGFVGNLFAYATASDAEKIELSDRMQKQLGNLVSTFTYPAANIRDVKGQFDPDSAPTPYIRDRMRGEVETPYFAEGNYLFDLRAMDTLIKQSTRFLPDFQSLNYTVNRANETGYDVPYYTPFSTEPINTPNPLMRQFGTKERPTETALIREMRDLNLRPEEYRKHYSHPNAAVDYLSSVILAENLTKNFEEQIGFSELNGKTYDELTDPRDKRVLLHGWLVSSLNAGRAKAVEQLDNTLNSRDATIKQYAVGYLRNMFIISSTRGDKFGDVPRHYDEIVTQRDFRDIETGKPITSYKDFLAMKDLEKERRTFDEEIERMQLLMEAIGYKQPELKTEAIVE